MIERSQAHPKVVDLLTRRWSPRAFDASEIPQGDLDVIFEAAAWAPSAYNAQPWRFCYARRGDANWDRFLGLLMEFNQGWARNASVLIFAISDKYMRSGKEDEPESHSHSFDTGAAWQNLALQATAMGYHAHGMTGIHVDKAARELGVPDDYRVEAAIAIGRKAPKEILPEKLQERENPNGRKPASSFAFAGDFHAE